MSLTNQITTILKEEGAFQLFKKSIPFVYNRHIASRLPGATPIFISRYNGVAVNVPFADDRPFVESGLITGIKEYVQNGDKVTIVGGGRGVTAVRAAQKVGESGKITVYEGSLEQYKNTTETSKINNVGDRVDVIHGLVGPEIGLLGEKGRADHISPEQLPDCDVLELDCEGAEIEILQNLSIRPRVILVETHGPHDAPSSIVEDLLQELSYTIETKRVADNSQKQYCVDNDIYSIAATRE